MQKAWEIDEATVGRLRNQENWQGSFYELGLAFALQQLNQQRRSQLLQEVWNTPYLQGVVRERKDFGKSWLPPAAASTEADHHCYGCIRLNNGQIIGCGSLFIEVKSITWFVFYIPLGMLDLVFPVNYPISKQNNPWRVEIDNRLASLGMRIYRTFPFELGAIGEEAGAVVSLERLQEEVSSDDGLLVPERLFHQLRLSPRGSRSPEGLWWTGGNSEKKYEGA
jgi:hypothetical protein